MQLAAAGILPAVLVFALASLGAGSATAQQQGVLVVGATSTNPLGLQRGCNLLITDAPNGNRVAGLPTLVTPQDAVVSIWRYDNLTQTFKVGYFADQTAPTDFTVMGKGTTGRTTESYFICISKAAEII